MTFQASFFSEVCKVSYSYNIYMCMSFGTHYLNNTFILDYIPINRAQDFSQEGAKLFFFISVGHKWQSCLQLNVGRNHRTFLVNYLFYPTFNLSLPLLLVWFGLVYYPFPHSCLGVGHIGPDEEKISCWKALNITPLEASKALNYAFCKLPLLPTSQIQNEIRKGRQMVNEDSARE